MNARQRTWLAASLLAIGAALAAVALQWDARPPRDSGIPVIVFFEAEQAWPGGQVPPCRDGAVSCEPWERAWGGGRGGLLPLVLFAAAGFVALGRGEKRA